MSTLVSVGKLLNNPVYIISWKKKTFFFILLTLTRRYIKTNTHRQECNVIDLLSVCTAGTSQQKHMWTVLQFNEKPSEVKGNVICSNLLQWCDFHVWFIVFSLLAER